MTGLLYWSYVWQPANRIQKNILSLKSTMLAAVAKLPVPSLSFRRGCREARTAASGPGGTRGPRACASSSRSSSGNAIGKRAVEIAVEVPEAVPLERNFDGHYPADAIALGPDYGKY